MLSGLRLTNQGDLSLISKSGTTVADVFQQIPSNTLLVGDEELFCIVLTEVSSQKLPLCLVNKVA